MIAHYTRMAVKALLRFKLHSVISFFSLGFGFICFVTAVLLSNYLDSFDQHFPNADRIYNLVIRNDGNGVGPDNFPMVSEPAAKYLRSYFPEIPNIVMASSGDIEEIALDGQAHIVNAKYVEERFFDIFPMETLHGIAAGEALPPNGVMITEEAAQRLFGRSDVVGERLMVANQFDVAIAGVAKKFEHPSHIQASMSLFDADFFVPMELQINARREDRIAAGMNPDADEWGNLSYFVYLQFPEDTEFDRDEFHDRLDEFVAATVPQNIGFEMRYEIIPVNEVVMAMLAFITGGFNLANVLIFAGILVLMIGCLNYSNLVIAQLSLRSQEIGVQKILGSKRGMLIFQYCYESFLFVSLTLVFVLAALFVVLGMISSAGLVGVGPAMLLNPSLWLSIGSVVAIIVLIAGGYPALRTATVPLVSMMRPKGSSGHSGRLRALMVGIQFFISGTLMIQAFVMFAQNSAMTQQLDGEVADPKIIIGTSLDTYTVDPEVLATELRSHPGIVSVTQVDITPWSISSTGIRLSRDADLNATTIDVGKYEVGYDYAATMDIDLVAGRDFSRERSADVFPNYSDLSANSGPFSIMLNDQAAQSLGFDSAEAAIGQTVYRHEQEPEVARAMSVEMNVIAAFDEMKYQFLDFGSMGIQGNVMILRPDGTRNMIVRISKENVNEALVHIDETWNRLMPTIPVLREFTDNLFLQAYNLFLTISLAIAALSMIGFLIASIGLLGNATFITNIRQKEVGIRKVMGASSSKLLRMLLMDFAKPILIANVFAWPVGYLIGSTYVSLFAARSDVGVTPFVVSLLLSVLIAVAAVASQSWKSAKQRPAMVLRYE